MLSRQKNESNCQYLYSSTSGGIHKCSQECNISTSSNSHILFLLFPSLLLQRLLLQHHPSLLPSSARSPAARLQPGALWSSPVFVIPGCRRLSFSAGAVWAMKLPPAPVPQHPSRTCSAGCMNRFRLNKIRFNRFRHREFLPGTETTVGMGMV